MNTTQARVALERYLSPTTPTTSIAQATNYNKTWGNSKFYFSTLLALFTLFVLFNTSVFGASYYVSISGNDSYNGTSSTTPWQTLSKVNNFTFAPGDKIYFKRGDTWRGSLYPQGGNAANYMYYGAYGTGEKPLFLGSVSANNTSDWTNVGGNIWQNSNPAFTVDVGNLIFNNETSCGTKIMSASPTINAQGKFWYDFVNDRIRLYSIGNPASFYSNIECELKQKALIGMSWNGGENYITFQNLDFRYWYYVWCEGGNFINFYDVDMSFIGGNDMSSNYASRDGNGLQMWEGTSHDINIIGCKIDNVYDAGITYQGFGSTGTYTVYNLFMRNNLISNCEYSFEFFDEAATSNIHDIYFENNTCINAGGGWAHSQRPDGAAGNHILILSFAAAKNNIFIRNNILYNSTEQLFRVGYASLLTGMVVDYNAYFQTSGGIIGKTSENYGETFATLPLWKARILQETHSVGANPLLDNNYLLQTGSPCINVGINVGLPYTGAAPDLGAYEYTGSSGNNPPSIQNQTFQLNENSANGTAVGTVVATDPDAGQTLTYSILSGNTNSAFAINVSTGALTVATSSALNYETITSFALIVKVQDNGTGNLSSQATITVNLLNINEPPLANNQTFSIPELSANGTLVGTVLATDPDAGQTKTFAITSGNTSTAFSINSTTGVITVAASTALNFLVNPVFNLNVRVTDNGTGNLFDDATITINLTQGSNQPPVITNQTFQVNENLTNGTSVGTVVATDPNAGQTLSYSIMSGNTNSAFAISATSGNLTIANSAAVNYEVLTSFALVVKVQDNGTGSLSSQAIATQVVINLNEPPVVNNQVFSIPEFTTNGTIVGTVVATDPDAGQTKSFGITSGNTSNAFLINSTTGVITVAASSVLNFLINPVFNLNVRVTDNGTGNLFDDATITINLTQGSTNQPPVIANQTFSVSSSSPNGTIVGTVVASDPNAGQTLVYSILSGNTNGAFTINPSTGVITVANSAALANSSGSNYSIFPAAPSISQNSIGNGASPLEVGMKFFSNVDGYISGLRFYKGVGGQGLHIGNLWGINGTNLATATFTGETASGWQTVTLNTPVAITANTIYVVSYFSQHGDYVKNDPYFTTNIVNGPLTALGWTASQPNGVYKYSSTSAFPDQNAYVGSTNYWADVIFTSSSSPSSFVLAVKVQDNGTGSLSSQANMTINVSQQSTNLPPVISNQAFAVNENSTNGTTIGTVVATDPDAGQVLTFSIMSGNTNGAFTINTSTGLLTVANSAALNYESAPYFALTIKVQDNGAGALSSSAIVTISLNNVNEYPIVANQTFSVNEFASKGTIVGTVVASDPDVGQTLSYAITAGNTSTAFSINSSTGKIKVNNRSALNYSINPVFNLTVRVKDNGTGQLASFATITINVIDGKSAYVLNIASIPQDTITVGLPYYYGVIGYSAIGTVMHYSSEELPNWLSFNDNGNGTATLEGIPGNSDIGYYQILVKGFDSLIQVEQSFSIEVKSASISGIPNKSAIGMHIFPNPVVNGILNVKLDEGIHEQFELSIWDNSGKLLMNKSYQETNLITLDLSAYPPASYVVQIRSFNLKLSKKFIIL